MKITHDGQEWQLSEELAERLKRHGYLQAGTQRLDFLLDALLTRLDQTDPPKVATEASALAEPSEAAIEARAKRAHAATELAGDLPPSSKATGSRTLDWLRRRAEAEDDAEHRARAERAHAMVGRG